MASVAQKKGSFSLRAYRGDAKTLLAFDFSNKAAAKNLAGFTIACQPPKNEPAYYIYNDLRFEKPGDHAQVATEPANSSINAPIHKFRWVHVPGQVHQGLDPSFGNYTYTVTPRFFDGQGSLKPLDPNLSASVPVMVDRFVKGNLTLGFARGYTQSQAFVNHFGKDTKVQPDGRGLQFDTSVVAGKNAKGEQFTYRQAYDWLGFTARERIFELLNEVLTNKNLVVDVFAYDLNEPDLVDILLKLAGQGRIRIILDNAALHHQGKPKAATAKKAKPAKKAKTAKGAKKPKKPPLEDDFEKAFVKAAGKKQLLKRGKFGRYAHDKVFVVYKKGASKNTPVKVLTGSTNFSVTGIYVNSNHILVYDDAQVAGWYASVFAEAWKDEVKAAAFEKSDWAKQTFSSKDKDTPKTDITFSPHDEAHANTVLKGIVDRIKKEGKDQSGSVLFAVMTISSPPRKDPKTGKVSKAPPNPVYDALRALHSNQKVFSFGISDSPGGTCLYPLGKKTGVLVTGKPVNTQLPPPFNQVPNILGVGHQIHHKFVVCGFRGKDPVVFCGSSNLALGGEMANGDNLLAVHDDDVATVFAIEALLLVDHFNFLDSTAKGPKGNKPAAKVKKQASKQQAAANQGWFLSTNDGWVAKYFDPKDLHSVDRELFA